MTTCRIRVVRGTPVTGAFEWATFGEHGKALQSGASNLRRPAIAGDCEVVIASELVLLDRVAAPAAQQRRLASALRFLVEDRAIPDPERLHVAAEPAREQDTLCIGIVDRQWLQELLQALERAGLNARAAYPECLLPKRQPRRWTVIWSGNESFARTGEAEGFVLDGEVGGERPDSLKLALETARSAGKSPERIVVCVGANAAAPDLQRWAAALGIPLEPGPAWRWSDAHPRPSFNLLQGEFAPRGRGHGWLRSLRRPAILAAALLVVGSCGIAVDWGAKAGERAALVAEMHAVYKQTFGERAVVVDAPLQMSRALADLRQQAGQIGAPEFLALLKMVAGRLPDSSRQRLENIQYDNAALTVTLRPPDPAQTGALLEELRAQAQVHGFDVRVEATGGGANPALRVTARATAAR